MFRILNLGHWDLFDIWILLFGILTLPINDRFRFGMNIIFYTPFKPLNHANPSGDLVTATGIFDFLVQQGHRVYAASDLRCRWIYWKPWLWPKLFRERQRVVRSFTDRPVDLWFTYHSYYKAPDLLGPAAAGKLNIPYAIFQGIYSTKRRRQWTAKPGFYLNKNSLCAASHVFTNKTVDLLNLKRLLPASRATYVAPGIVPGDFDFDGQARTQLRDQWNVGNDPVIFSAAMFRPDVKTQGLTWLIRACGELYRQGQNFQLVIAGDGKQREKLQQLEQDEHKPKTAPDNSTAIINKKERELDAFILNLQPDELSPRDALELIYQLKKLL